MKRTARITGDAMHKYIPNTEEQKKKMLEIIGVSSVDELFSEIPADIKMNRPYRLDNAKSEIAVARHLTQLANQNLGTNERVSFLGAGSYDHYIPSVVNHIISRSEFYTSYTPYQPEVAQGTLQYIFEYQTMMTELTGLDVSNASMYDGATATAEAINMATATTRRHKVLVASNLHPYTLDVIETYGYYRGYEIIRIKTKDGFVCREDLMNHLNDNVSCFVGGYPNFYGLIEDFTDISEKMHEKKALMILNANPLSLGVLKTPGEMKVDICVGEAQVFGIPQSFGGPYLGYLTCTEKLMRKMPGRVCGETKDVDGKRSFVLTLQAREQHIRREKANSNICSNQSLNVLMATIYLSVMGKQGIVEVCHQNIQKAHYAFREITKLKHFESAFDGPFFNEFVVKTDLDVELIEQKLKEAGIISGLDLSRLDPDLKGYILFCVTEKRTKEEIDKLVEVLGGIQL